MHETATEATAIALMREAKQGQPENAKAGLDMRRAVPNDSPTVVGKHHGLVGPLDVGGEKTRPETRSALTALTWVGRRVQGPGTGEDLAISRGK